MSFLRYFAADKPLREMKNPYVRYYSVNEAREAGIKLDYELLANVDPDKKNTVLWCESEDMFNYPNIYPISNDQYTEELGTDKKFCAELQCGDMEKYTDVIAEYIKSELKDLSEIELWCIDLGYRDKRSNLINEEISLTNLSISHVLNAFDPNNGTPSCLKIINQI